MRRSSAVVLSLSLLWCCRPPLPAATRQEEAAPSTHPNQYGETPNDPQVLKRMQAFVSSGERKAKDHDFAGAVADFSRCIELAPRDARGYSARGAAKALGGDLAGGVADCKHAIDLAPKYASAYYFLGRIENVQGDYSQAEANANRALELRPDSASAWYLRGRVRLRQGREAEALKDVAHVTTLPAQDADGYMLRGDAHDTLGHPAEAITDYQHALALGEKSPHTFYRLAYFQTQEHRYAVALEDAQRSLRQPAGKDADYPQLLCWILQARAGDQARADGRLSDYLAARPHTPDGEWSGHVAAFLLGRESEEALLTHAASGDPKKIEGQRCEAWYYAGVKKLLSGDKAGAAERFRKCMATRQVAYTEYALARGELQTL